MAQPRETAEPPTGVRGPAPRPATVADDHEGVEGERSSPLHDAAVRYAQAGLHVFPLQPGRKEPLTVKMALERGHLDATNDAEVASRWWTKWPRANIGVALEASGLVLIDVDPRNGGDLGALERACDLGAPVRASTGGGGWHLFYADRGVELRSSLTHIGLDGIDVKRRGYAVVAPSVTTGPYAWDDDDLEFEPVPAMVMDMLRAPLETERTFVPVDGELDVRQRAYVDSAVNGVCERLRSAPEGTRHSAVYYSARCLGEYVGGGVLARDRALRELTAAAERLYGEALWKVETKTIEQGLDKGARDPRGIPDEFDRARKLLERIATSAMPSEIIDLYYENSPELLRTFGHDALELQLLAAIENVVVNGGVTAADRFYVQVAHA